MKREEPTDALEGDDLGQGRAPIGVLRGLRFLCLAIQNLSGVTRNYAEREADD